MYPLFETIAIINGLPQNLSWHQLRVKDSFGRLFNQNEALELKKCIVIPDELKKGVVKCRICYNSKGYTTEFSKYVPRKIKTLRLVEDDEITYEMKFSDRSSFDSLLSLKGTSDEILIVKNKQLTDTSYTNIVFFDGYSWLTPRTPLLKGTCRARLISEGRIFESDITEDNLHEFRSFKLINAMMDFDEADEIAIENIV